MPFWARIASTVSPNDMPRGISSLEEEADHLALVVGLHLLAGDDDELAAARLLDRLERAAEDVVVGHRDRAEPFRLGVVEELVDLDRAVVRPARVQVEVGEDPVVLSAARSAAGGAGGGRARRRSPRRGRRAPRRLRRGRLAALLRAARAVGVVRDEARSLGGGELRLAARPAARRSLRPPPAPRRRSAAGPRRRDEDRGRPEQLRARGAAE